MFESCGQIGPIRVNKVAHFAFLEGLDAATGDRCVALNGIEVGGKKIRVEVTGGAVKKDAPRGPGGPAPGGFAGGPGGVGGDRKPADPGDACYL